MVSRLLWLLLLPALQSSLLLLLLLSSPSPLRVQPPAQLSESGRNREQVPSGPGDRDLSSPGVVARLQALTAPWLAPGSGSRRLQVGGRPRARRPST